MIYLTEQMVKHLVLKIIVDGQYKSNKKSESRLAR